MIKLDKLMIDAAISFIENSIDTRKTKLVADFKVAPTSKKMLDIQFEHDSLAILVPSDIVWLAISKLVEFGGHEPLVLFHEHAGLAVINAELATMRATWNIDEHEYTFTIF